MSDWDQSPEGSGAIVEYLYPGHHYCWISIPEASQSPRKLPGDRRKPPTPQPDPHLRDLRLTQPVKVDPDRPDLRRRVWEASNLANGFSLRPTSGGKSTVTSDPIDLCNKEEDGIYSRYTLRWTFNAPYPYPLSCSVTSTRMGRNTRRTARTLYTTRRVIDRARWSRRRPGQHASRRLKTRSRGFSLFLFPSP